MLGRSPNGCSSLSGPKHMMPYLLMLTIFCAVFANVHSAGSHAKVSALKNRHLIVAAIEYPISVKIKRNSTGQIVELGGVAPLIIKWLSRRFKFQYKIEDFNASTIEDKGPNVPGLLSYVSRGECDVIMSVAYPNPGRISHLEFVHPWMYTQTGILIPMLEVSYNNVDAVIKPFKFWVWMGLVLASMAVMITLWCFNIIQRSRISFKNSKIYKTILKGEIKNFTMYILGTLLNQAGYLPSKATTIRFVIGGWCLLVLVLLNTYNGTLISYMTATPSARPLVNSFEDLVANPNINLVIDKGRSIDIQFSTADKGIYKALGDKLRSYSGSRCNSTQQCIDMVKMLPPQHVYITGLAALRDIIKEEYQHTKKCHLTIAGNGATGKQSGAVGWVLAKKSPYLNEFNLGFSILQSFGLVNFWEVQLGQTLPCFNEKNSNNRGASGSTKRRVRLTLFNLAGAFTLLVIGCLISIVVFVLEIFLY